MPTSCLKKRDCLSHCERKRGIVRDSRGTLVTRSAGIIFALVPYYQVHAQWVQRAGDYSQCEATWVFWPYG